MLEGSPTITIKETTQPEVSGHLVGVSNIWERELADGSGAVAPRMSAALAITPKDTREVRHEKVVAGSQVKLGADVYCVEQIAEGKDQPGSIVLRKVKGS